MEHWDFDIIVVGGGHAGVEAALAVVRMGKRAAIVTMDRSKLALMSCNPSIGGTGKSHLVKEIDALGGLMGRAIDATGIQFRRLNLSRGPAVWSTRAQADRRDYNRYVCDFVVRTKNVEVIEDCVAAVLVDSGCVIGVQLESGLNLSGGAVIVCSGTFLRGLIHIGEKTLRAGRMGERSADNLSSSLRELGFEVGRLKTGTPPRLDGDTIDWSRCQRQPGEEPIPFFSYGSPRRSIDQASCHLTYTTEKTKEIVVSNLHLSPIFSGQIRSTGPRYCPSIEAKYHRFPDKDRHQVFLEPEGNGTNEIYPNGFATGLPEKVQVGAITTVAGLEDVRVTSPGYAIEYDYCPAYQVKPSLETRRVRGLFFSGQINGTSGYEEAGAQGLVAGINAVLALEKEPPFVLDRSEAYMGVLVDDLCTRSTTEPYRMFTSRAEYRLALREDNARDRLFGYARRYGLIPEGEYRAFVELQELTSEAVRHFNKLRVKTADIGSLGARFTKDDSVSVARLMRQPGVTINEVYPLIVRFDGRFASNREVLERAAIQIRYSGYIEKQQREIEKFKRSESVTIPEDFDFARISGLKCEAQEKFIRHRPRSLGQAARIEGVSPGDVSVLAVYLKRHGVKFT